MRPPRIAPACTVSVPVAHWTEIHHFDLIFVNILIFNCCISLLSNCNYDFLNWRLDLYANESSNLLKLKTKIILNWVVSFTITILNYYYYFILFVPVATFAFLLVRKVLPVVSLENWDLGSGPWFLVVDPGVHYRLQQYLDRHLRIWSMCVSIDVRAQSFF